MYVKKLLDRGWRHILFRFCFSLTHTNAMRNRANSTSHAVCLKHAHVNQI